MLLISSMNMLNAQPVEAKTQTHEMEDGVSKAAMGASSSYFCSNLTK